MTQKNPLHFCSGFFMRTTEILRGIHLHPKKIIPIRFGLTFTFTRLLLLTHTKKSKKEIRRFSFHFISYFHFISDYALSL